MSEKMVAVISLQVAGLYFSPATVGKKNFRSSF